MKKFNLNYMIKVKLTDYGKDIFYHRYDEINDYLVRNGLKPIEPCFPEVDDDGFSKFQLWYFMNIYGKYLELGFDQMPIENLNIYIDEKDLDEV